ncbi:MAG: response regulator [Nitrosomonas sp.]|nr:response regulator [Nitrosomonas sp.]
MGVPVMEQEQDMNVLLIDDEAEICFLLKNLLGRMGIGADMAHSLAHGREKLHGGPYQVVFLDIHLPDGLGYQLIPEIRGAQPEVRVIAISAVDNERAKARELGADLFIAKPLDKNSILDGLRKLGLVT